MSICRQLISKVTIGSTLLTFFGCPSQESSTVVEEDALPVHEAKEVAIDLDPAIAKRIEGDTKGAIKILNTLAEQHPHSVEVFVQLGRTLMEAREFPLAAFRFEEAISKGANAQVTKEAAEAHYLSNDFESATERYGQYLEGEPGDPDSQLRYARLLARIGRTTESINAFVKAGDQASANDCRLIGDLFLAKKLFPQSKHWFKESLGRSDGTSPESLHGLLRVSIAEENDAETETLILALEKLKSGFLETTDLANYCADFIRRRRLAELISKGIDARSMSVTELAAGLIAGSFSPSQNQENIVSSGPKFSNSDDQDDRIAIATPIEKEIQFAPDQSGENISLAAAFASPIEKINEVSGVSESPIELGRIAFIDSKYTLALMHARDALKNDSRNSSAWALCSQAHFQLGEIDAAEMTILEAIRHQPMNNEFRLEYLRIARETLPADRYLQELEKAREIFPDSVEILWELARRYHLIEKMPVTASILYRKVIEVATEDSSIAKQAKIELIKIEKL